MTEIGAEAAIPSSSTFVVR